MAMGMRNRACREVSKIMGDRPPKVVRVVSRIGRKRWMAASRTASLAASPFFRLPVGKIDQHQRIVHHDPGKRDNTEQAEHAQAVAHDDMADHRPDQAEGDGDHDDQGLDITVQRHRQHGKNDDQGNTETFQQSLAHSPAGPPAASQS